MVTNTCILQTIPERLTSPDRRVCFVCLRHAVCWAPIACTFFHQFFICWNFKEVVGPFIFRLIICKVAPGIYFEKQLRFWFITVKLKFCCFIGRRRSSSPLPLFFTSLLSSCKAFSLNTCKCDGVVLWGYEFEGAASLSPPCPFPYELWYFLRGEMCSRPDAGRPKLHRYNCRI